MAELNDPERMLAASYAPAAVRGALVTLWRLDERLGQVVAATRDEAIGAIRLAWWREALERLDVAPPPDEPLLGEIAASLLPRGPAGAELGRIADGWAALLAPPPLAEDALGEHATARGARLFRIAGRLLGDKAVWLDRAGEGWALADLARNLRDRPTAERALALAGTRLAGLHRERWPVRLRALGALAMVAADDVARGAGGVGRRGSPGRVARMLRHRITGR